MLLDQAVASTSCPYCSNAMFVSGIATKETVPNYILPFAVTKERARELFQKHFSNRFYMPFGFKAELEHMQAVYVPYWLFSVETSAELGYFLLQRPPKGSVLYKGVYRAGCGSHRFVPIDASNRMPDAYMDAISPFDLENLEEFTSQYVAGFVMELPDVAKEICAERAAKMARNSLKLALMVDAGSEDRPNPDADYVRKLHDSDSRLHLHDWLKADIDSRTSSEGLCVLPVWLLHATWKDKDLLFAINGRTGECVGDLPVSEAKRGLLVAVTALICILMIWLSSVLASVDANSGQAALGAGSRSGDSMALLLFIIPLIVFIAGCFDTYCVSKMKTVAKARDSRDNQMSEDIAISRRASTGWHYSERKTRRLYDEAVKAEEE